MMNTEKKTNTSHALRAMTLASLFAALCCAATLLIRIPSPMQGYVNLGDCIVLCGAWLIGPWWGAAAGGIGSALADLIAGYPLYIPGTLVIKALMAAAAGLLFDMLRGRSRSGVLSMLVSSLAAESIMVLGYFVYASLFLGKGLAAAASIPGNLFQAACGIICAVVLPRMLMKSRTITDYLSLIRGGEQCK